jgi:hypothetical protein
MYDDVYVLVPIEPRRDDYKTEPAREETPELIVRQHPLWLRLQETIMTALRPFAEARAAVLLALEQAQPVNCASRTFENAVSPVGKEKDST